MFASNFIVEDSYLRYLRGQSLLKTWENTTTIASGNKMTNHFCSNCGSLLFRASSGFPGKAIMRLGTVDDFNLVESKLKPDVEQFTKDRVAWLGPVKGARQVEDSFF